MLLNHAKIEFEDVRIPVSEYGKLKEHELADKFEFKQVPVLEMNGKFYSQSHSILRMLGRLHGYYPEDPFEAWKVDSVL